VPKSIIVILGSYVFRFINMFSGFKSLWTIPLWWQ